MLEAEDQAKNQDLRLLCIQLLCDLVKIFLKEEAESNWQQDELSSGYALQKLAEVNICYKIDTLEMSISFESFFHGEMKKPTEELQ